MGTLQERVSYLEGKVEEQSQTFSAIRDLLGEINRRIDRLEQRLDAIEDRMSRQFLWLVGIQITTLLAVVGAVLSRG